MKDIIEAKFLHDDVEIESRLIKIDEAILINGFIILNKQNFYVLKKFYDVDEKRLIIYVETEKENDVRKLNEDFIKSLI